MTGKNPKRSPQARRPARLRSRLRAFVTVKDSGGESLVGAAPVLAVRELFTAFWPYARPYRRWIPVLLGLIAIGAMAVTVEIWLFKLIVDQVIVPGDLQPLIWIGLAYLGLTLLSGLASFGDDYVGTLIGERFVLDLRSDVLSHLQKLSPDYLDGRRLGDLLARLGGDVAAIESFILSGLADALSSILRIVFFVTALFLLDWQLALAALVVAPAFWLIARWLLNLIREASREKRRRSGSLGAVAEQALANQLLVRSSNREDRELERYRREGEGALQAELTASRAHGLLSPLVDLVELAGAMFVIVLGTLAVADGSLTLGGLLAFVTYLGKLYGPARDLTTVGESVFAASAGAERVIELLETEPEVRERPNARALGTVHGEIEFDGVEFTYLEGAEPALRGVDLRIAPGECVAVVGATGAGKSTLAKLLLRFHDPQRGAVRLDGWDLRELELASLRRNVSILLQEAPILHGTVRENVSYGMPEAGDEQILAALGEVGGRSFVEALPQGLDTQLGERGRRLSGGQRQRIAMARALLRSAPVLVLDEPGTGFDEASKDELLEPLRRLARGRTTIVITHDRRFTVLADRVLVFENGELRSAEAQRGRGKQVAA